MSAAIAWIITLPGDRRIAVGALEFVHVLPDEPSRVRVPGSPPFMREAIVWDDQIVPVFDAQCFGATADNPGAGRCYGIVRYRPQPSDTQQFGGLVMSTIPRRVEVNDEMACALADSMRMWRPLACACFQHEGHVVPVLDLARLFSRILTRADGPWINAESQEALSSAAGLAGKRSDLGTGWPESQRLY